MKKLFAAGIAVGLAGLTGCSTWFSTVNQNTPHTTFKLSLGTASVTYESPKDVVATNVMFSVSTNGTTSLSIGSISATQDTNAISDTAQALLVQANGQTALVQTIFTSLQALGVSAAKTAAVAVKAPETMTAPPDNNFYFNPSQSFSQTVSQGQTATNPPPPAFVMTNQPPATVNTNKHEP